MRGVRETERSMHGKLEEGALCVRERQAEITEIPWRRRRRRTLHSQLQDKTCKRKKRVGEKDLNKKWAWRGQQ